MSEGMDIFVDLDKNLLREIIGVVVTDHHFTNKPIHLLLILPHQQIESVVS